MIWLALYVMERELAHDLRYILTAITAGLPAIATASYGIRIILDFEGNSNRAKHISLGLNGLMANWETSLQNSATLQDFAQLSVREECTLDQYGFSWC